jgi:hypothetical protein
MRVLALLLLALVAGAPGARAAESFGLQNEELLEVKATVVDVACELLKDCPARCGDGRRQLGLKTADGTLLLAAKNQVNFMGAVRDLLPFCGKEIDVDGLKTTNKGVPLYMIQRYRSSASAEWRNADQSIVDWAKANHVKPDGPEAENWMRSDPAVKAAVAKKGRLGVPE